MNLHAIKKYSEGLKPLQPDDSVQSAISLMHELTLRCYPVAGNSILLGYVHASELAKEHPDTAIRDFIRHTEPFLTGDETIYDIVDMLISNQMDCLALAGRDSGEWQGMVKAWDVLRAISKSATFHQDGSCLVLEMSALQYSLSRITQICEQEDEQVIGVLIDKMDEESNVIQVHLKINGHHPERLVGALIRFGYDVLYYNQSDTEPGVIKERYDALMKFLDI